MASMEYCMDDSVERVKLSARVKKGRGFEDSRDSERIQYESIEDTGGPGPMRCEGVCGRGWHTHLALLFLRLSGR